MAATEDDFDDAPESAEADSVTRFRFETVSELLTNDPPGWIVKDLLPSADLAVIYGASGKGMTLAALELASAIVRGLPWRDRRAMRGRVIYVPASGAGRFRCHFKTHLLHHQLARLAMGVIRAAPNLLERGDAVDLARSIVASGGARVIFIDALDDVMPGGDVESSRDVSTVLANCRLISASTGALVVLMCVSPRGASRWAQVWPGLRSAADAELEVMPRKGGWTLKVAKQRDAAVVSHRWFIRATPELRESTTSVRAADSIERGPGKNP